KIRNRERQGDLLDRPGPRRRRLAAELEWQLDLRPDRSRDDLGLGVLGDVTERGREHARPGLDRVEAADLDPPGDCAAMEMRDEAAGRSQERRLAAPRASGEDDELTGADSQRDVLESATAAVRIGVADGLER